MATEAEALAGIIAAMVGARVPGEHGDPEIDVAARLLGLLPPDALREPDVAVSAARDAARLALEGMPTPTGMPVAAGDLSGEPVDLAWGGGYLGLGQFAREMVLRARYAVNAARRLAKARTLGDLTAGLAKERAHAETHKRMQLHREAATRTLDEAVRRWGFVLSWNALLDDGTTPECREAHGSNFDVRRPPSIGLPGLGPHGGCRCFPGPPRSGAVLI